MALTIKQVEAAKPQDKAYKLSDDDGLYLLIHPNGSKYWRYNHTNPISKKQATKSYGVFPRVSIADARRAHAQFKDNLSGHNQSEPVLRNVEGKLSFLLETFIEKEN